MHMQIHTIPVIFTERGDLLPSPFIKKPANLIAVSTDLSTPSFAQSMSSSDAGSDKAASVSDVRIETTQSEKTGKDDGLKASASESSASKEAPKTPAPAVPPTAAPTPRSLNIAEISRKIGMSVSKLQSSYEHSDRKVDLFTFVVQKAFEHDNFVFDNPELTYDLLCFPGEDLTRAKWVKSVSHIPSLCDVSKVEEVFSALAGEEDAIEQKEFLSYISDLDKALRPTSNRLWDIARRKCGQLLDGSERLLVTEDYVNDKSQFPGRNGHLLLTDRHLIHIAQTIHSIKIISLDRVVHTNITSQGGVLKKGMQLELTLDPLKEEDMAHEHTSDVRTPNPGAKVTLLFSSMREAIKNVFKSKAEVHRIHIFEAYLLEVVAGRKLTAKCDESKGNSQGLLECIDHGIIVADVIYGRNRSDVRPLLLHVDEHQEELLTRFKDTRQWYDRSKVFTTVLPAPAPDASDVEFELKLFAQHVDNFLNLMEPVFIMFHLWDDVIQWNNPRLTAILGSICLLLSVFDLCDYIPALIFAGWAFFVYQLREVKLEKVVSRPDRKSIEKEEIGKGMFGSLRLKLHKLEKIQNGLQRTQNKLFEVNTFLFKLTNVHMWEVTWMTQTWMFVLLVLSGVFGYFSFRAIWAVLVLFFFTKRFRNPEKNIFERAIDRFWTAIPPVDPVNVYIDPKEKEVKPEPKKTK
eukprot:TRINITY_DN14084_c0_g1_i1.p1 TRINITY_DN14084_c0_g1~~TRINITY_DN14084_c0_g1_i1.p1  ORF type:complete len:688 (+),score=121.42 TRINITY_DN14084_c0_g1_i1:11-2074(+)